MPLWIIFILCFSLGLFMGEVMRRLGFRAGTSFVVCLFSGYGLYFILK